MDCARKLIANDGVTALWKGFGPAMARAFPANVSCLCQIACESKADGLGCYIRWRRAQLEDHGDTVVMGPFSRGREQLDPWASGRADKITRMWKDTLVHEEGCIMR
jgi:hypothetical protein